VISMFSFSFSFSFKHEGKNLDLQDSTEHKYPAQKWRDGFGFSSCHLPLSTACMLACLSRLGLEHCEN
jgi:hypothetical protein